MRNPYEVTFYSEGDRSVGLPGETVTILFEEFWRTWDEEEQRALIESTFLPVMKEYLDDSRVHYLLEGETDR